MSLRRLPPSGVMVVAYRMLNAHAGTYTISGSTFTIHFGYSGNPNLVGQDVKFEFTIQGDRLTDWRLQPDGARGPDMIWRKVG